ncbi:MAG: lytic transglycosylase domain-containing protein [Pseudomonadales bacterium]
MIALRGLGLALLLCSSVQAQLLTDITPEQRAALKSAIAQASSFEDRFDAEVWLVDMSTRIAPFVKDKMERLVILKAVHAQASIHQLPIDIVLGLIETESHFKSFALSSAGAQGVMQIMPFWKREIGTPEDNLMNIETNIRYGTAILKHYLKRERGDMEKALSRYNGSYGRSKYPNKVFRNSRKYK